LMAKAIADGDVSLKSMYARKLSEESVNWPKHPNGWRFTPQLKRWYAYAYQCLSGRAALAAQRGDIHDFDGLSGIIPSPTTLLKEYLTLAPSTSGDILRQNIIDHVDWMKSQGRNVARIAIDARDIGVDEEPDIDDRTHAIRGVVNLVCIGEDDPAPLQAEYRQLMLAVDRAIESEKLADVEAAIRNPFLMLGSPKHGYLLDDTTLS
jgi:hypothetical protein